MEIVTIEREEFEERGLGKLNEIPGPPERLWMRGSLASAGTKHLAVVGSRALSSYGRQACEKLIQGLAGYPLSIVSGLALGADACAHKAALTAGLHTIAIPGSGLRDRCIAPQTNLGLARHILQSGGALVSEHEPDHVAAPYDFPSRNRIMAGLADAVLVIEAGPKSGTLITARLASEYNRDLLCVPHRIEDPHGYGSHLFIRLGAVLVTEPSHILEALTIPLQESAARLNLALSGNEQTLYDLLDEPRSRDELIRACRLPVGDTLTALVTLELKGIAKEEFGAWHRT